MEKREDLKNVVLVSKKPLSSYIMAAKNTLEKYEDLIIKARGKNIYVAINLAEVIKREGLKVKSPDGIVIGTERFKAKEDPEKEIAVSTVEIHLIKE